MAPSRRRRLFVDFKLQGMLMAHTTVYWFYCLLSICLIAFCWIILVQRPDSSSGLLRVLWTNFGPALIGSLLLLPIVLLDCLRLSNRFAGPLMRLQRGMRELANGETVKPIKLRKRDFWKDFADDFNKLASLQAANQPNHDDRVQPAPPSGEGTSEESSQVDSGISV